MDILPLLLISIGLSMDIFAVSIAVSLSMKKMTHAQMLRLALSFTIFHMAMLLMGFFLGLGLLEVISNVDHWVAFALLALIGGKMIFDSWNCEDVPIKGKDPTKGRQLLLLSVATSIDALAMGVGFAALHSELILSVMVIGIVVFAFGILGTRIGPRIGKSAGKYAGFLGGVVLILLAVKIVIEHVVLG